MSDEEKRIQETCEDCVRNGTGQCLICRRKNDLVNTVDYFSVIPENAPPIVRQLLRVYEEHKNDKFYTFQINYPLMAKDAANEIMRLTGLIESLQRERQEPEPKQPLQRRFALACRILADGTGLCPQNIFETGWEECDGEADECGDRDMWKCWQKFINETVESERVCRVCGCSENNACIGRDDAQDCCSWIEEDLCSACATDPEGEKKNET